MSSVLEFLKETETLLSDESIKKTPYAKSSAVQLKVYCESLKQAFDKEPFGSETRTWYTRANSVALGLEWHLAVIDEKYLNMRKYRQEAEILFKSMQSILADYNARKEQFVEDEVSLAEFAIVMNDAYKYYKCSTDYVWKRTVQDDIVVKKIKGFMEEYNNGLYFKCNINSECVPTADDESTERTSGSDGSSGDCSSMLHVEEERPADDIVSVPADNTSGDGDGIQAEESFCI